jgi:hypothetical protein
MAALYIHVAARYCMQLTPIKGMRLQVFAGSGCGMAFVDLATVKDT